MTDIAIINRLFETAIAEKESKVVLPPSIDWHDEIDIENVPVVE